MDIIIIISNKNQSTLILFFVSLYFFYFFYFCFCFCFCLCFCLFFCLFFLFDYFLFCCFCLFLVDLFVCAVSRSNHKYKGKKSRSLFSQKQVDRAIGLSRLARVQMLILKRTCQSLVQLSSSDKQREQNTTKSSFRSVGDCNL